MVCSIKRRAFECAYPHQHHFINMGPKLKLKPFLPPNDKSYEMVKPPWDTWMCMYCHVRMEIYRVHKNK